MKPNLWLAFSDSATHDNSHIIKFNIIKKPGSILVIKPVLSFHRSLFCVLNCKWDQVAR